MLFWNKIIDCLSPEVHSLCEFFPLDTEKKKKCKFDEYVTHN